MTTPSRIIRTVLVAERIEPRRVPVEQALYPNPLCFEVADTGLAIVFRYGVVALCGVPAAMEADLLERIRPAVVRPYATMEQESIELVVRPDGREGVEGNRVYVKRDNLETLVAVATVLACSTVLAFHEEKIQTTFDQVRPLAERMRTSGIGRRHARELLRHIGDALINQQMMIGSVQVPESPEVLWEHPELEPLYLRLDDEYEIKERWQALKDKLELVYRTAQTSLDLLQDRRSLRVEWYIVILIVIEIIISLYELFFRQSPH